MQMPGIVPTMWTEYFILCTSCVVVESILTLESNYFILPHYRSTPFACQEKGQAEKPRLENEINTPRLVTPSDTQVLTWRDPYCNTNTFRVPVIDAEHEAVRTALV